MTDTARCVNTELARKIICVKSPETIAEWVRQQRRLKGITQGQLAEQSGLGRTYINSIENGRVKLPQYQTRSKLHEVFGTTDTELVDLELLGIGEYGEEWVPERSFVGIVRNDLKDINPDSPSERIKMMADRIDWEIPGRIQAIEALMKMYREDDLGKRKG